MTEEQKAMADITGSGSALSDVAPIVSELRKYIMFVRSDVARSHSADDMESLDVLSYFSNERYGSDLPILQRIVSQIFQCSATSGEVERIFSRGGIVCTPRRNRFHAKTVGTLVFLHAAYSEERDVPRRRIRLIENTARFWAHLGKDVIDKSFGVLDSLCAWTEPQNIDEEDDEAEYDEGAADPEDI